MFVFCNQNVRFPTQKCIILYRESGKGDFYYGTEEG